MKVLVVDDDLPSQKLMEMCLRPRGHEVVACGSAELAWDLFQREEFGMALVDWWLPGMDGIDLCRKIRSHPRGEQMFLLVITGNTGPDAVRHALAAGADDYIAKPVDVELMATRVSVAEHQLAQRLLVQQAREALQSSEERYALAAQGSKDALWDWDLTSDRIYISPRWSDLVGSSGHSTHPRAESWLGRIHPDDRPRVERAIEEHLAAERSHFTAEYRIRHDEGHYVWLLTRGLAVRDRSGKPYRMAGSHSDLTGRAVHDPLTELPNRALLLERISNAIETNRRRGESPFAIYFIDVDRFKLINDSMGHSVGDTVLVTVAQRLRECVRPGDCVARLGGDEFVVLAEQIHDQSDAVRVAERIQQALSQPIEAEGGEVLVSGSIGVVMGDQGHDKPEDILRDADTAMYRAKAGGRARYEIFDPAMREESVERMQLVTDLRRAIRRREFLNYYEPIVRLDNGKLVGFEALIRWHHPSRGYVAPREFLPLAREQGLYPAIAAWFVEEAAAQLQEWRETWGERLELRMTANLESVRIIDADFANELRDVLERTGLAPELLTLEFPESDVVDAPEETVRRLGEIGLLSTEFSVDGIGPSIEGLVRVEMLPVRQLKLDGRFVTRLASQPETVSELQQLQKFATRIGAVVCAAGIDSERQRAALVRAGCEIGQGACFSQPLDNENAWYMIEREFSAAE